MTKITYRTISLIIYFSILLKCSYCVNILIMSTVPSVSHSIWNQKLAAVLADRGHHITVLDSGTSISNHKNITHIEIGIKFKVSEIDLNYFSTKTSPFFAIDVINDWTHTSCEQMLKLPRTKLFLEENKGKRPFDLIILDGACCESFLGFVEIFGSPPLVEATAFGTSLYLVEFAGNYDNPAYVPHSTSPLMSKMNFMERIQNTFIYLYYYYRYHIKHLNGQNEMARKFFGENISDVRDLSRRAVITLLNFHPAFDGVKPLLPSIIPIGGFHIEPPKPLEEDLQNFLDSSTNGAIYFSFGSNLKCESMDEKKFNIFVQTFREINLNVLWKCEKDFPNKPKNLRLGKWFKQNDVLAHPNVKIFISHGGLLGTQEAIYHGVPILVLPFVIDQHFIAQRLHKMGVAIPLTYAELSVKLLKGAINNLLTDQSFQERIKERSAAFRDNPMSPKDLIVFWIEYVLRHPQTDLLRSETQTMPIYQILLLDVILFLIVIVIVFIIVFIFLIKLLFKICMKTKESKIKTS